MAYQILPREELLARHQRCTLIMTKGKQFLDETMLPDIPLDEKVQKSLEMPDSINDGALLGMLAVIIDDLHQTAPSEQRFQMAINKLSTSIHRGEFFTIIKNIINDKKKIKSR